MIRKCEICGKVIRGDPVTFFSGSTTGSSTTTILCLRCARNDDVMEKTEARHDRILDKMDGF